MKVAPIKNIAEVKEVHSLITENFREALQHNTEALIPIRDTYDGMIMLLESNKNFQLKATVKGQIVGCAIVIDCDDNGKIAFLRTIVVKKEFQKMGIARKLLKILEQNVRKKGFLQLKIEERERANGFFTRAGYIPYLYVIIKDKKDINRVKKANIHNFKIIEEYQSWDSYIIKFDIEEELVPQDRKDFIKVGKNIDAVFVYEKKLSKKKLK